MLQKLPSAAVVIGALRVNTTSICCKTDFFPPKHLPQKEIITLCMLCNFLSFFAVCLLNFSKLTDSKYSFRNIIKVPNCLDPDQDQYSVGPDLGPNCLQRLSVDNKSCGYISLGKS